MPRRGYKTEIIKKDKDIFLKPEKSGRRRGRDRLFLKSEKPSKDCGL
jgi:hypothetical protein